MNCFDCVEERYMLNIHMKDDEDIKKILDLKTNLYKEIQGDWLIFYIEDDSDFQILCEDISVIRRLLYRLKYEAENCFKKDILF